MPCRHCVLSPLVEERADSAQASRASLGLRNSRAEATVLTVLGSWTNFLGVVGEFEDIKQAGGVVMNNDAISPGVLSASTHSGLEAITAEL